jgi:acyl transferase domain-containing protein
VIKMVMAMRHGVVPRTLHADTPLSSVDWTAGGVRLATEPAPWPRTGRPRRFGVSGFSASGTNAHVVVAQAPPVEETGEPAREYPLLPWVLSARSLPALRAQAARLLSFVDGAEPPAPADVAFSLATGRAKLEFRAAVLGASPADLAEGLAAVAAGEPAGGRVRYGTVRRAPKLGFLFPGPWSPRPGAAKRIATLFPVFADAFDEAATALGGEPDNGTPACAFAWEVALYRLVRSWGVRPSRLAGRGVGAIAADHAAGVVTLADAAKLVLDQAAEVPRARSTVPVGSPASLPTGGSTWFVELGPGAGGADTNWASLVDSDTTPDALVTAVSRLFVAGVPVDWAAFFAGSGARRVDLPTYPFQHRRFWLEPKIAASASVAVPGSRAD